MSWTHIEDTMPKARKNYWCYLCNREIPAGTVHLRRVGVFEGELSSTRMHIECEKRTKNWGLDEWEYHDWYEFRKAMDEESIDKSIDG